MENVQIPSDVQLIVDIVSKQLHQSWTTSFMKVFHDELNRAFQRGAKKAFRQLLSNPSIPISQSHVSSVFAHSSAKSETDDWLIRTHHAKTVQRIWAGHRQIN